MSQRGLLDRDVQTDDWEEGGKRSRRDGRVGEMNSEAYFSNDMKDSED